MALIWYTAEGEAIPINQMTNTHLLNALNMLHYKRNKMRINYGIDYFDPEIDDYIESLEKEVRNRRQQSKENSHESRDKGRKDLHRDGNSRASIEKW